MAICAVVGGTSNVLAVPYSMVTHPRMIHQKYGVDNRAGEAPGTYANSTHLTVDNGVLGSGEGEKLVAQLQRRLEGITSLEDARKLLGKDYEVRVIDGRQRAVVLQEPEILNV